MLLVLFACSTGSIELGTSKDSSSPNVDDSAPTDDSGLLDSSPDSEEDTEEPPPSIEGDYAGDVDGLSTFSGWGGEQQQVTCIGEASLAVGEDGSLSGEAICTDEYRNSYEGSIEGSISLDDFAATATWTVDFGWQPFEIALEGDLTDDTLTLGANTEIWQGSMFEVEITAVRQ